jgi:hypothetical protein
MYDPPLPATTSPKSTCRPEWDLTAFAQLSMEQFHLRSFPRDSPTKRPGSKPDGGLLELPDRTFQAKSEANTPTPGEVHFTPELTGLFTTSFTCQQERSTENKTR